MAGPLQGVTVLDMTRALAGPYATMLLGDMGARVIKVEHPDGGDETRRWGPPFATPRPAPDQAGSAPGQPSRDGLRGPRGRDAGGSAGRPAGQHGAAGQDAPGGAEPVSTYFLSCNRNKESVTADLRSAAGRALMTALVLRCDVLVENFRAGVMDRLGFGPDRLLERNPRLVICSITGFGHDGPDGGRPGYDQIVQGESGLMSVTGTDPEHLVKAGLSIADVLTGAHAAAGILAALHQRAVTGRGQVVRTSLLACMVGAHAYQGTRWTVARQVPTASGNHHPSITPYGAFRCADGMVQVCVANEAQWRRFAPVVGIDPGDPRYAANPLRNARQDELIGQIEAALAGQDRAHWLAELRAAQVPAGSIRTIDEVYSWEQTRSQGLLITVQHPELGSIELPGPALRFDGQPPAGHAAPPVLGQHDAAVRAWLEGAS